MPILKRRLDICGREKNWEYLVEAVGQQYRVTVRQLGHQDPSFSCTCGAFTDPDEPSSMFYPDAFNQPCSHIAEAQRDLNLARQAAAQMVP